MVVKRTKHLPEISRGYPVLSIPGRYRCIESILETWYDYESALIFYSYYMIFLEIVNSPY